MQEIPQGLYNPPKRVKSVSLDTTVARLNALNTYANVTLCIMLNGELLVIDMATILNYDYIRYICKQRDGIVIAIDMHWSVPIVVYIGKQPIDARDTDKVPSIKKE
jgi:hypothetical protein